MITSSKYLNSIKERDLRKKELERNLFRPKRTCLPTFEFSNTAKTTKCRECAGEQEDYGITFEWNLEPVDVFKVNKGGFANIKCAFTRLYFMSVDALVIHPAQIKMIKYLQNRKPIVFVLNSRNIHFEKAMIDFIFYIYDIQTPHYFNGKERQEIEKSFQKKENLIFSINDENELRNVLMACSYGEKFDVYWLPISIGYEILESFHSRKGLFSSINKAFGIVKVSFLEPYTAFNFSKWDEEGENDEEKEMNFYDHLLHDIFLKGPILATNIVAYLLLTDFRKGGKLEQFAAKIDELRNNLSAVDFSFEGNSIDVAAHAITILEKKVIIDECGIIRPKSDPDILIELWEYAQTLACHFSLQSIIALSIENLRAVENIVDYNKMLEGACELSRILTFEFPIYNPCHFFKNQLENAFKALSIKEVLSLPEDAPCTENERNARRIAKNCGFDDSDDDEYSYSDEIKPEDVVTVENQNEIDLLKNIILPVLKIYLHISECLKEFIGSKKFSEEDVIHRMQAKMINKECEAFERCILKSIKNIFKYFEMDQVIEKVQNDSSNSKLFILKNEYNDENGINELKEYIESFTQCLN